MAIGHGQAIPTTPQDGAIIFIPFSSPPGPQRGSSFE
jgi:hypothetical protein